MLELDPVQGHTDKIVAFFPLHHAKGSLLNLVDNEVSWKGFEQRNAMFGAMPQEDECGSDGKDGLRAERPLERYCRSRLERRMLRKGCLKKKKSALIMLVMGAVVSAVRQIFCLPFPWAHSEPP